MTIKQLKIQHLRNITEAELQLGDGINFISGDNGSGKSSLLEAIYMLGRGRSYRTTKFGPVVQQGEKSLNLFAISELDRVYRIGLLKTNTKTQIKVNGTHISRLSDIARIIPMQILTPLSHEILERGPEYRRRFLEWGVFHVEHSYFNILKKYLKALRQRNTLLRHDPDTVAYWNPIVGELGETLNRVRETYFVDLRQAFRAELGSLGITSEIDIQWRRGWEKEKDLVLALKEKQTSDIKQGFTHAGPHRADMRITYDNRSAFSAISRGQQKMIISALHLAQASLTQLKTGKSPIILFDDLVAELDRTNRERLLNRIRDMGLQSFVTSTDPIVFPRHTGDTDIEIIDGSLTTRSV